MRKYSIPNSQKLNQLPTSAKRLFDIMGSYFVASCYDYLYKSAVDTDHRTKAGTVTETYKSNVLMYARGIGEVRYYHQEVKNLFEYYCRYNKAQFADFIDIIVKEFIPEDYFAVLSNSDKESALRQIMMKSVKEFTTVLLTPDNLLRIIDEHGNKEHIIILQDTITDIFVEIREEYGDKFLRQQTGHHSAIADTVMITQLRSELMQKDKIIAELESRNQYLFTRLSQSIAFIEKTSQSLTSYGERSIDIQSDYRSNAQPDYRSNAQSNTNKRATADTNHNVRTVPHIKGTFAPSSTVSTVNAVPPSVPDEQYYRPLQPVSRPRVRFADNESQQIINPQPNNSQHSGSQHSTSHNSAMQNSSSQHNSKQRDSNARENTARENTARDSNARDSNMKEHREKLQRQEQNVHKQSASIKNDTIDDSPTVDLTIDDALVSFTDDTIDDVEELDDDEILQRQLAAINNR